GVDLSHNAELILYIGPAECHHHIRRITPLNQRLRETERPFHRLFRENHTGKIRLLQEFNEATDELLVVSDDIEKNAATVGGQHDVSRFWLVVKFGLIAYAASAPVAVLCYS